KILKIIAAMLLCNAFQQNFVCPVFASKAPPRFGVNASRTPTGQDYAQSPQWVDCTHPGQYYAHPSQKDSRAGQYNIVVNAYNTPTERDARWIEQDNSAIFTRIDDTFGTQLLSIEDRNRKLVGEYGGLQDPCSTILGDSTVKMANSSLKDLVAKVSKTHPCCKEAPLYATLLMLKQMSYYLKLVGQLDVDSCVNEQICQLFNAATFVPVSDYYRREAIKTYGEVFILVQQSSLSSRNIMDHPEDFGIKSRFNDAARHQFAEISEFAIEFNRRCDRCLTAHVGTSTNFTGLPACVGLSWLEQPGTRSEVRSILIDTYRQKLKQLYDAIIFRLKDCKFSDIINSASHDDMGASDGTYFNSCFLLACSLQSWRNAPVSYRQLVWAASDNSEISDLTCTEQGRPVPFLSSCMGCAPQVSPEAGWVARNNVIGILADMQRTPYNRNDDVLTPGKGRPGGMSGLNTTDIFSPYLPTVCYIRLNWAHYVSYRMAKERFTHPCCKEWMRRQYTHLVQNKHGIRYQQRVR
ncbi:MAG: hypothetical protein LBR89_02630, partial [Holosporales bacterium]|nr:hypothetical protein [Holosporales bacterium]